MNRGCRNFKKGDIVRGLEIISEPYTIEGDRNYRGLVKCTLCDSEPFETVLGQIKYRVFDGCGCQTNRSNSKLWKSFKTWCVENDSEYLLDLWDYDLNTKTPDQVSYCTSSSYYFKCPDARHESELHRIDCIAIPSKNKRMCTKCNSFAQYVIDKFGEDTLDLYWDYERNEIDPWEISHANKNEVWIKCLDVPYHESYLMLPVLFLQGNKCPYCHRNRIHPYDSFAYYYTQKYGEDFLDKYWDYEENTLDPWNIAVTTNKGHVYLKCAKHGTYPVLPSNFYKFGITCPECTRERDKSKLQEKVEDHINNNYDFNITHEYNCSIVARSPKTNRWLPYDNDVIIKDEHLIIEVMGEQHYSKNCGLIERHAKRNGTTPDQELADLQWRDEYKKQYALSQGYHYLAVPYWTEQDESYKTLIDNKIQEILTIQN